MTFNFKDKDLLRRLRFYGFGLLMGCCLVSVITKGKACRMPGTLKLEELTTKILSFSKEGKCRILCMKLSPEEIKLALKKGSVNYGKSEVHAKPNPSFAVDTHTADGHYLRLIIEDLADTSKITKVVDLSSGRDTCHCN